MVFVEFAEVGGKAAALELVNGQRGFGIAQRKDNLGRTFDIVVFACRENDRIGRLFGNGDPGGFRGYRPVGGRGVDVDGQRRFAGARKRCFGPIELEPAIFCRLGTPECGQSRQANDGLQACVQVFHTNLSFKVNCCVV